jgi:hypothetical protein
MLAGCADASDAPAGGEGLTGRRATPVPENTEANECNTVDPSLGCPSLPEKGGPGESRSPEVTLGPTIEPAENMLRLEMQQGNELVTPVTAYGNFILLSRGVVPAYPNFRLTYELWDPLTGTTRPAWEGTVNHQDWVLDSSNDWLVTVRTGLSLPFADWELILRNPLDGEEINIAASDPAIADIAGLTPRLPLGFAPTASISGPSVVWVEFYSNAGEPKKRIRLYNLETREARTLVEVDPRVEDVWQVSIGGTKVAWAHSKDPETPQELIVLDLQTSLQSSYSVGGEIYSCALSSDGVFLTWDDNLEAKFALNLESGERVQYAAGEGWGTNMSGHYVAWTPSNPGGYGGYYDLRTKQVRFVRSLDKGFSMNLATVMGEWFVWQEMNISRAPDRSGSYFYFDRLPD